MARMEKIWMKRMNIPIWVAQLLVMLIFTGAAAVALYAVDQIDDDYGLRNDLYSLLNAASGIQLGFSVFTIILIIVEIIMAATHRLGPVGNIVIQCIKSLIWTFFFCLSIYAAVESASSGWSIFLVLVMFLTCMAQLIYGAVIVHRHRKGTLYRGDYALTEGGQAQHASYQPGFEASGYTYNQSAPPSYASPPPNVVPYPHSADTAYKPQGTAQDYYAVPPTNTYEMHAHPARY